MSLTRFRRPVVTVSEDDSAAVAARRLRDSHVGCAVVTRGLRPIGIVTDRDLAIRVVAEGLHPELTRISEILTYDPFVVCEESEVATAADQIRNHGVRRLPIVNEQGDLTGIVTADELVVELGRELASLSEGLKENTDSNESR